MNEGVRVSVIDRFGRKVSVSSDAAGESSGGDWFDCFGWNASINGDAAS